MSNSGYLRPEVLAFAHLMEKQLRENDHKPGWKGDMPQSLALRVSQEGYELIDAVQQWVAGEGDTASIGGEAADVANMAMMVADVCGALSAAEEAAQVAETKQKGGDEAWSTNQNGTSDDLVAVPRNVIAAACYIIRKSPYDQSNTAADMYRYSLSAAALSEPKAAVGREEVAKEAAFLCERLREFAPVDDETGRDFYGHVLPSVSRLEGLLKLLGERR